MKILSAEQIRALDQYTIQHEPVDAQALMERASQQFVSHFCNDYQSNHWVKHIFCGPGNNGGDGFCIARLLHQAGHPVKVYIPDVIQKFSQDATLALEKLKKIKKVEISIFSSTKELPEFQSKDVIIDAIFGSGLNKAPEGIFAETIIYLNASKGIKIAVDMPSGLFADRPTTSIAFMADRVYTFQVPKLAFLLPENGKYVERFKILDIRLHNEWIEKAESSFYFTEQKSIQAIHQPRLKFTHKGTYGHALLIAGSYGKMGAAVLSAQAANRSGVGLLTIHTPEVGYSIIQNSVPEAMCSVDENPKIITRLPTLDNFNAIGIGPGIGMENKTAEMLETVLKSHLPKVLDADALNLIALNPQLKKYLNETCILTPHPKEFSRLAGQWNNDFERLELQRKFSKEYNVVLVLKGAHSSISTPDGTVYFNSTGNSGMSTGGSGDVLTGILTGLLAQGYSSIHSARLGVYLHGLAGNMALENQSKESLIASDITEYLGRAFKRLTQS